MAGPRRAVLLCCSLAARAVAPPAADTDVIVVGAGWAGISAARRLAETQRRVLVLEARHEAGGRSRTLSPFGNPLDMGSSWTTMVDTNPIAQMAKQYNFSTVSAGGNVLQDLTKAAVFSADGKRITGMALAELGVDYEAFDEEMRLFNNKTVRNEWGLDRAMNATFGRLGWGATKRQQLRALYEFIGVENAAALSQFSVDNMDEDETAACGDQTGGDSVMFPDGFGALARTVAADFPSSVTLRLNTRVTAVDQSAAGVTVRTADGGEFTASHAVITVSLGLLQRRSIDMQPPLAAPMQRAIDNAGWGTVNKLWLEFPADAALPWTPLRKDYLFYLSRLPARFNFFFDWHSITGLPYLMVFCSGDCAVWEEGVSESDIVASAMGNLRTVFPDAPEPARAHVVRWHSDNSTYGSYSFFRTGEHTADRKAMLAPSGRVWLAGEAIGTVMEGFTHGAWMSGLSAADAIVQGVPAERAADFRDSIARSICPNSTSSKRGRA